MIGLVLACATTCLLPATVGAQDKPVTLRYTSNAPPKSPWAVQIERLVKAADEESKGTIKIEPYLGGQLGNEQDTIQQIARGRIDMGGFSAGSASLVVPEVQLSTLPFYFRSVAEADCMLDKVLAKPFGELFDAKGIRFLGFSEVGAIDLVGKRSYADPKSVTGIKAVAYSKTQSIMWTALGANSSFVGVPEWSSALQTGLIDTVATPSSLYVPSGLGKIAGVVTRLGMWNTPGLTVVSKAAFDRLSPSQQAALQRAVARDTPALLRGEIRGLEAKLRDLHVAGGGQIVEATAEQVAAWRATIAPTWPEMLKAIGGQAGPLFAQIEAGRASCQTP